MKIYTKSFKMLAIFLFLFLIIFTITLSAQVLQQDSLALIAFYDSTNGDNWGNNSGWKTGPVSTWHGITLTGNRVTQIILNYNGLSGNLPVETGNLSDLVILYIGHNAIGGAIPSQIGNLTNLVNLDISSNSFSGSLPPELGNLSSLEKLYADHNNFNNSIPSQIGNLSSLLELELANNQFSGNIPPELGNLSNITAFFLNNNQLSGSIPHQLGRLSSVRYFNLSYNQLDGSIPDSLGNLNVMSTFDLSNNQLSGNIPVSLGNITSVGWGLMLHNNQLTGSIPSSLGSVIMQNISLYNNQLTGSIPSEIGSISQLLGIYLQNNQLTGTIPTSIFSLSNLQRLDLSYNQIADTISRDIASMPSLGRIYLNNNQLTGNIPPEFGHAQQIQRIWLNDNQLGESIPVELVNNRHLTELYLHNNNFSVMPDMSNGNLSSSIDFKVEDNFLDFADLETNANLSNDFTYSPQAIIGEQLDTLLYAGDSISFSLNAGGTSSVYHWYKDSIEIHVSNDTFLVLDHVQIQNEGEYYCVVTNTIATQLSLFSRPFNLIVIDTTAPGIPQNLTASAGDSMIALSWNANHEPDSIYYRIYADTTSNPVILIDSTSGCLDTTRIYYELLNDVTYYIRITAIDLSKNESGFSNEIFATPVYIDSIAPAIPQNLAGIAGDSSASLSWNMVNDPDSIYYRVYMDTVSNPSVLVDSTFDNADTTITINNLANNATYYFRVTSIDKYMNESDYSNEAQVTLISTGVDDYWNAVPTAYSLEQNYPNPFNPVTTIAYALPKSTNISMIIYDILGQHVCNLFQGYQSAGFKKIKWSGKNDFGNDVNSGVYFYQLISADYSQTRKLILIR